MNDVDLYAWLSTYFTPMPPDIPDVCDRLRRMYVDGLMVKVLPNELFEFEG